MSWSAFLSDLTPEEIKKIPKKTLLELSAPAGAGERHFQVKRIVIPMIGNGFSPERVFELLRARYDADMPDQEIWDVIRWARDRGFEPSGLCASSGRKSLKPPLSLEQKLENAEKFLNGFRSSIDELVARSPVRIYGEPRDLACLFLWHAYGLTDLLNIMTDFTVDDSGKACPRGGGQTRSVYQWRRFICAEGVPQSEAGCWFRLNPVRPCNLGNGKDHLNWHGSGYGGAYTDGDIERFAYVLVESDCLPLDIQASLLAKLPAPISAIVDSGGKSLQARVLLENGLEVARAILEILHPCGFDRANGNASRLSRFPGAIRKLQSRHDQGTEQRLVFLSANAEGPIV